MRENTSDWRWVTPLQEFLHQRLEEHKKKKKKKLNLT
jgi:hypothetical protein